MEEGVRVKNFLFIINLIANLLLYQAILKPIFNMLFDAEVLPQILWLVLVVGLSFATTIYTFSYLKKNKNNNEN